MAQRSGSLYTFGFAGIICVCCAFILANAATVLKPRQEANAQLDILVNILGAVGHDVASLKKLSDDKVFSQFEREFQVLILDAENKETNRAFMDAELIKLGYPEPMVKGLNSGALLSKFESKKALMASKAGKDLASYDPQYKVIYVHQSETGNADAYVIPIEGFGLWNICKGYMALSTDLNTVQGVTFYEHKETPGLGALITTAKFQDDWKGKKILDKKGNLISITVAKGLGKGENQVDGLSGATLTGKGINKFLMEDLKRYEPYFKTLRRN